MIELHLIIAIFGFVILSFFDIIVYNEEVLLTLCFLSFLFYCFNTLSESVFASFESRAAKIELDLLQTFSSTNSALLSSFNANAKLESFINMTQLLLAGLLNFLSACIVFLNYKNSAVYYTLCSQKFNELVLFNNNLISFLRETLVIQLLYSLILKKSGNDLSFLLTDTKSTMKFKHLKSLSF